MANKTLGELIAWLEDQPPHAVVRNGFADPHTDRGYYTNLAFDPIERTTIGDMLVQAQSALGKTFEGWKGGEYEMHEYTNVRIGHFGECGESITDTHFKWWMHSAETSGNGE